MGEALSGSRAHVSLASILQLVDGELVTGWLSLSGVGRIGFVDGQICHAECGRLTGADAVRSLFLSDGRGSFTLSTGEVERGVVSGPLIALIMDGVRLTDEWNRLAPMRLALTRAYEPRGGRADAVVSLLDGERTIYEAALEAEVEPVHVVDPVLQLLESGHLREAAQPVPERVEQLRATTSEAEPTSPPEPDPLEGLDSFDLTALGRRRLRERDFDGAEAAFERALTLEPGSRIIFQNLRRVRQLRQANGPFPRIR